jgi:hypothetical protein
MDDGRRQLSTLFPFALRVKSFFFFFGEILRVIVINTFLCDFSAGFVAVGTAGFFRWGWG